MQGHKRPFPLPEAGAGEVSRPRKRWRTVVLAIRAELCWRDNFSRRETGTVSFTRLLEVRLVSMVRTVVAEEVRKALAFHHAPPRVIPIEENHPQLQLKFLDKVKQPVYTTFKVERQNSQGSDTGLRVAIYNGNEKITSGTLASAEIEILILPGEFYKNGRDNWTREEFQKAVLVDRENKPAVLPVKRVFKLSNGEATIDWLEFGDNSSWTRDKMFRLGIRVLNWGGVRVKEGITEPFPVLDRRMEGCKKHYPPVSSDKIWRLKGIRKNGDRCKSLNGKKIDTVKDLLDSYHKNKAELLNILGGISETSRDWKSIIEHAETCPDYNRALGQSDQLPEALSHTPERTVHLQITGGPRIVGSGSSVQNPCENNLINPGAGLQVVIPMDPIDSHRFEDLLANNVEFPENNYPEFRSRSRSNSFDAGSCEALVERFKASISYNGEPVSPRMKAKIKVLFKVITFLASPRKRARGNVPRVNQTLVPGC